MDKILNAFTSKKHLRNFDCIQIKNGFAYATDSFRAIKYKLDSDSNIDELNALATLGKVKLISESDEYPNIDMLIPNDETIAGYTKVKLNAKYLAELAKAFASMTKKDTTMEMYIPKDLYKPLVFKKGETTALLMTISKD